MKKTTLTAPLLMNFQFVSVPCVLMLSQLRDLALGSDTKNHGQRLMDLHVH